MKGDDVAAASYEAAFVLTSKGQAAGTKKSCPWQLSLFHLQSKGGDVWRSGRDSNPRPPA